MANDEPIPELLEEFTAADWVCESHISDTLSDHHLNPNASLGGGVTDFVRGAERLPRLDRDT